MQTVNALWKALLALPGTDREYSFEIGGTLYDRESQGAHQVEQALYDGPAIGRAQAARLTLTLFAGEIPAGAEIRRRVRLKNGEQVTDWLPAGVYTISRRSHDGDRWEITAFDALYRADRPWEPDPALAFPAPMGTAAADIAGALGVSLDSRCSFQAGYAMSYPADCTLRQALGYIAAAHGGNWTVTPAGALRLVPLAKPKTGSSVQHIGQEVTDFADRGSYAPVSRVTLRLDDETAVTTGDDSGLELAADCPDGTEAMARTILNRLRGWQYRAFSGQNAALSPEAEPGDTVEICGVTGILGELHDRGDGYPDTAAPGEGETPDEALGPVTREFRQKLSETRSAIRRTAEEIRLEVENQVSGLSSSLSVGLSAITARVEDNEAGLSQTLRLGSDGLTVTNAAGDRLTIDGGQIDASAIRTADLQLSGRISWSDLASDAREEVGDAQSAAAEAQGLAIQAGNNASSALSMAAGASAAVTGWTYPGTTYIDGRMLMTGTVRAGTIEGGEVYLLDAAANRAGSLTLSGASSYEGSKVVLRSGALELAADWGELYFHGWYGTAFGIGSYLRCEGDIAPTEGGVHACGMAGHTWTDIWADNGVIQRSDLRTKEAVSYDLGPYGDFYDRLAPMSFRFSDGSSGRRHIGLGAQDVAAALTAAGIPDRDFAGFIRAENGRAAGEDPDLALRYGEFIPLNIWQIQLLKRRVAALEARLGLTAGEETTNGDHGTAETA